MEQLLIASYVSLKGPTVGDMEISWSPESKVLSSGLITIFSMLKPLEKQKL